MRFPPGTRKDHERFCTIEGWTKRTTSTGKTGTHHVNYELVLPDGRILLTRVSHPVDRTDYGTSLWAHILREQLDVTPQEFWDCVHEGRKPDRGVSTELPAEAIPIGVVTVLVEQFHIPESEVRSMSKDDAIQRMVECYSRQRRAH